MTSWPWPRFWGFSTDLVSLKYIKVCYWTFFWSQRSTFLNFDLPMTLSPILTFEWDSPSLSMILGFRRLQKLILVLRYGFFLIFKLFCIMTFLWPWALCRPFCEIATSKQMILSFKIFSIALSSPKIWRFKVGSYMFVCYSGVSTTAVVCDVRCGCLGSSGGLVWLEGAALLCCVYRQARHSHTCLED